MRGGGPLSYTRRELPTRMEKSLPHCPHTTMRQRSQKHLVPTTRRCVRRSQSAAHDHAAQRHTCLRFGSDLARCFAMRGRGPLPCPIRDRSYQNAKQYKTCTPNVRNNGRRDRLQNPRMQTNVKNAIRTFFALFCILRFYNLSLRPLSSIFAVHLFSFVSILFVLQSARPVWGLYLLRLRRCVSGACVQHVPKRGDSIISPVPPSPR